MTTVYITPDPSEGSWLLTPEYEEAWAYLNAAIASKSKIKPSNAYEDFDHLGPITHAAMLRPLERLYLLAPIIKTEDLLDFLGFCETICYTYADHHRLEETFIFPELNRLTKTTLFEPIAKEHDLFMPPTFALWHYIRHCRTLFSAPHPSDFPKPWVNLNDIPTELWTHLDFTAEWDGTAVQRHMDTYMLAFVKHIPYEGITSKGENLTTATDKEIGKLYSDLKKKAFWTTSLYTLIPLLLGNLSEQEIRTFFIPNSIINRIVAWWFGARHAGWWRLCTYPEHNTWAGRA